MKQHKELRYYLILVFIYSLMFFSYQAVMGRDISKLFTAYSKCTKDEIEYLAANHDLLINTGGHSVNDVRAINPHIIVLVYYNIIGMQRSCADWELVDTHEDWFVHDSRDGSRLINNQWNWYLMDVGNPGWREYYANSALSIVTNYDGIFCDDAWHYFTPAGFHRESDGTKAEIDSAKIDSFVDNMIVMLQLVKETLDDKLVIFNGNAHLDYMSVTDGGMYEHFLPEKEADWRLAIDRMVEADQSGKIFLAYKYKSSEKSHRFSLSSYLLGKGNKSYFTIKIDKVLSYPDVPVPLGDPVGTYFRLDIFPDGKRGHIYRRNYSNGFVIVNPSDEPYTIELGRTHETLDGKQIDYVNLGNYDGIVLFGEIDVEPPGIPTNLEAIAVKGFQIDLNWSPSSNNFGVVGYKVYRDASLISTVGTTNYSDTGLRPDVLYTYSVIAYDAANNQSGESNLVTIKTLSINNLIKDGDMEAPGTEAWKDYEVSMSKDKETVKFGNQSLKVVGALEGEGGRRAQQDITGLSGGESMHFEVWAKNESGYEIIIRLFDSDYNSLHHTTVGGDWKKYSIDFTNPAGNDTIQIAFYPYGVAYFDQAILCTLYGKPGEPKPLK